MGRGQPCCSPSHFLVSTAGCLSWEVLSPQKKAAQPAGMSQPNVCLRPPSFLRMTPQAAPPGPGRCRARATVLGGTRASPPGLRCAQGRHCWPHKQHWASERLSHQSPTALTAKLDTLLCLHSRRSVGKPDGWCLCMWLPRALEPSLGSLRLPPQHGSCEHWGGGTGVRNLLKMATALWRKTRACNRNAYAAVRASRRTEFLPRDAG